MPRPVGSRALRRLGEAMARHGIPLPDEYGVQYDEFLEHYDKVRADLTAEINSLDLCGLAGGQPFGWRAVGRTKSRGTLLDKLRDGKHLDSIRDIAGVRIVANCTLTQQTLIASALRAHFGSDKPVIDRREHPTSGYRALHLEVRFDDTPAEIQIRTRLQHIWAELYEGLGDKWGRQIRYGKQPEGGDSEMREVRYEIVRLVQSASTQTVSACEGLIDELASTVPPNRAARRADAKRMRRLKKLEKSLERTLVGLAATFDVAKPRYVPSEHEVGRQ